MSDYPEIAARFAEDTSAHRLQILKDDGLYRHLRFSSRLTGWGEYWFDLITWPGCLTIRGDYGEAYTFTRELDMFPFFRADRRWGINPHYWAQKLDGHRQSATQYSEEKFRQIACELFVEAVQWGGAPRGIGKAFRRDVLNEDLHDEFEARKLLEDFEFQGFTFGDVWELNFHDFDRSFLWACHAIAWGIGRYDRVRKYGLAALATPKEDKPAELTVYRASHDSIVMGLYTTDAEARKHCEALIRRDIPGASLDWIEDEEDGIAELVAAFGEDERSTGYLVMPLEVASEYDPDADE